MSNITLVTGLWNIGRENLEEGWSRSFSHYLEKFEQLLKVEENLIIFGEKELEEFLSLNFFPRFGAGIGLTRLARAYEMNKKQKQSIYKELIEMSET